jgi:tetratricopeptide (TPR) repeat protein
LLNHPQESITHYEAALNEKDGPAALQQEMRFRVAQLYLSQNQHSQAIKHLQAWVVATEKPSEDAYALLAQAYYQTNHHQLAVENMQKALALAEQKQKTPREEWLLMLQQSFVELGLAARQETILKWLIHLYPKQDYLLALANTYGILEQPEKQLAILEVAMNKGYLTREDQWLNLAYLMLTLGAPYRSALVVERGLREGRIETNVRHRQFLANAWMAAREFDRAVPLLEALARESNDAVLFRQWGNALFQAGQWRQAALAFEQAIQAGNASDPGGLWLILGQSQFSARQFDAALTAFDQARQFSESRSRAERWQAYTKREMARRLP